MKHLKRRQLKQDGITRLVSQQNNTQERVTHEKTALKPRVGALSSHILEPHQVLLAGGGASSSRAQATRGMRPPHQLHPLPPRSP